jgi:hypothetical protein
MGARVAYQQVSRASCPLYFDGSVNYQLNAFWLQDLMHDAVTRCISARCKPLVQLLYIYIYIYAWKGVFWCSQPTLQVANKIPPSGACVWLSSVATGTRDGMLNGKSKLCCWGGGETCYFNYFPVSIGWNLHLIASILTLPFWSCVIKFSQSLLNPADKKTLRHLSSVHVIILSRHHFCCAKQHLLGNLVCYD